MKNKALMGLIATATIGTAIATPAIMNNKNTTHIVNKVLMVSNEKTNEAVVINGNSKMNLYALANGSGIVSNLSTGEMLTILGQVQNGYCKVRVQETGAVGYINVANMQNILNGNNDSFTQLSGNGQVINVSSNVRLRSNPAIGNNIIGHLTNGTILNILGKQGQWYKVNVNGQTGFIYEEYVSTNIASSNSQSLTNNINTNLGNTSTSATSANESSNSNSSINSDKHIRKNSNNSSNITKRIQTDNVIGKGKNTHKNAIKFTNSESRSDGKVAWNNVNIIPNNMIGKTVNTNPNISCEIFNISSSTGKILETINKKSVPLKVLGQSVEIEPGTQNNVIWYKVKTPNGLVGYVNQSLTYSALCYTNPDYKVNILNAPYTTGSVLKTILYKEEPIYVINQVIGISPKTNKKEYYFEVSYDNHFTGFINIHDLLSRN